MLKKIIAIVLILSMAKALLLVEAEGNEQQVDKIIQNVLDKAKVPGISVAITDKDKILYEKGHGIETIGNEKMMSPNSLNAIGSITKSLTTLAVLQQVEKGKLSLDDLVIKYIPEFKTLDEEKSKNITIRMLLTNSSGLPHNVNFNMFTQNNHNINYIDAIKENRKIKLFFEPGTAYQYSNEGFVIAGRILEIVTGMKYTDYLRKELFQPMEMNQTTSDIEEMNSRDVLYGHNAGVENFQPAEKIHFGLMIPAGSETRSTVHELSNYLQMLMNDGVYKNSRLLDSKLFAETIKKSVVPFSMYENELKYGFGWMHDEKYGIQMHGGQTATMSSMLMWDKEKKIGVAVQYNVAEVNTGIGCSTMETALNILKVYTKSTYEDLKVIETKIDKSTKKDNDDTLNGKYILDSGLATLEITEGNKAKVVNVAGIHTWNISVLSDQKIVLENLAGDKQTEVIRGNKNEVTAIMHPLLGKFNRVNEKLIEGYKEFNWKGKKIVLPNDSKELENGFGTKFGEVTFDKEFSSKNVVEQTQVRELYMNGKLVKEKIFVVELDGKQLCFVNVDVEGTKITGKTEFSNLTYFRCKVLKPMLNGF
jgi:CubicO group peptidase (beta-lactamase class C family)